MMMRNKLGESTVQTPLRPMLEIEEMYRHVIREHSSKPRNYYVLEDFTHSATVLNTLCGDEITVYCQIVVEPNGENIGKCSFDAAGCAIMKASASLMTESLQNCSVEAALSLASSFSAFLHGDYTAIESESPFAAFAPVRQYSSRVKCALLPFQALTKILQTPSLPTAQNV